MSFADPLWLLGLLAVPLGWLAYRVRDRRARRFAIRFPAVGALRAVAPIVPIWRRHLPQALALAAIATLAAAIAKPQRSVAVPFQRSAVMLVTDHSGSMQATDVKPTRLAATKHAANAFVDKLPKRVQLGVVTYSGNSDATQTPTMNHALVRQAVNGQVADGATATGDALNTALTLLRGTKNAEHSAVVLLSDGTSNTGSDPVQVATQRGKRSKIPVYTVALGTAGATMPNPDPFGAPYDVSPDPGSLRQIAHVSGGRAFRATDGDKLDAIYKQLGSRLGHRTVQRELTAGFVVGGIVTLLGAAAASQLPMRRWA